MEKKKLFQLKNFKYVFLVAAVGVICMLLPMGGDKELPMAIETTAEDRVEQLTEDLKTTLSCIKGVGKAEVILTVDRGTETVLASDESLSYKGDTLSPDDYNRSRETVTLSGSGGVVVTQEVWPKYRGALIVCEGGDDPVIQLSIVEAVSAVTGLGSDKISVLPWEENKEDNVT